MFKSLSWAIVLLAVLTGGTEAQRRTIAGRVTDETNSRPVPGAQIVIKGTNTGTLARADGTFTLPAPQQAVTLEISFIGYKRVEVPVAANQANVQVVMRVDVLNIDEIVVTGQASTVARRNLANAVGTVNARQLSTVPATSTAQALQGKLAGASIIEASGAPGGSAVVTLRGVTSINGAFTPLYVIDGVIASDVAIPRGSNFISQASRGNNVAIAGENASNRISDLNPNDIEKIEILKGAAASAIYGSKASNGVIIVTTKRGQAGAPQYTFTQRVGTARNSKFVGSRKYQTLEDAVAIYGALARDPVTGWKPDVFFDNERELANGHPFNHETLASVSGGTENTRYYASMSNKHEGGIVTNTFADKRSFRLNLDQTASSRISFGLGADLLNTKGDKGLTNNENNSSSLWAGLASTPSFFDLRQRADGSWPVNPFIAVNPLHTAATMENIEEVWRMIANARLTIDAIATPQHTLRFIGNGGVDFFNQDNRVYAPPELQFEALDALLGTSVASESRNLNNNINLNAVYTFKSPALTATTQVGSQFETRELRIERILAANLTGGLQNVTSGTFQNVAARRERVNDQGYFAQQEVLTLNEKLLVTVGLRADRSSNNGDPHKLFYFPKASASYRFTNILPGVDELKFRMAAGQSGNQPLYGQKFTEFVANSVDGAPGGVITTTVAAEDIVPERERELEGGIDGTLFGARATFEVTGYEKRITDLLLRASVPTSYGYGGRFLNGGVLRTRGIEVAVSGAPIQNRTFSWSPRVTFHAFRAIVQELPVPRFGGGGFGGGSVLIEEGGSATAVWGDDTIPGNGPKVFAKIGETRPDWQAQLANEFRYKSLSWSFLLDRSKGGIIRNATQWGYDQRGNSIDYDDPAPGGLKMGVYRPTKYLKWARQYIQDVSYLKLREANASFEVPVGLVRSFWGNARYARLTLSGRNLLTWTPYEGTDPEQRRQPETGLAAGMPGEIWAYPPSRSFWFAVEVGF